MLTRLGLFDRTKAPKPDDSATTDQIKSFGRLLAATPGFLWLITDNNERTTQINSGRAYVRTQLAGSLHGLSMQRMPLHTVGIYDHLPLSSTRAVLSRLSCSP